MSNIARAATTFFFLSLVTESLGQYRAFQWTFGNNVSPQVTFPLVVALMVFSSSKQLWRNARSSP